jgi:LL-diaminopimelate aminotransferase
MKLNKNFLNLKEGYLFAAISEKVAARKAELAEPAKDSQKIISLGIGDVTLPLTKTVIEALNEAVSEMSRKETFKGYAPYRGYPFLIDAIKNYYKETKGVSLDDDEIFVSDGAKSDVGNILDIFEPGFALVPDPVYPVYVDTNVMAGAKIKYINAIKENNFLPAPDIGENADLIYLCSPNNPTGAVYNKKQLKSWVDYAIYKKAVILFDSAYEAFITDKNLPSSIFEIEGAEKCAIEFCSFSKTAGFTGMRCAYTVIKKELEFDGVKLNDMWTRRQATKFNGTSYVTQRAAAAAFSDEGLKESRASVKYYLENAKIICDAFRKWGVWFTGGANSPYVWFKCPKNYSSWEFFDLLLSEANVVSTPGAGFGVNGEGFTRLTAFGTREDVVEALSRIERFF